MSIVTIIRGLATKGNAVQLRANLALVQWRRRLAGGKHSSNPFVVTRFIGSDRPVSRQDRMNAVTTNSL